jgi:hypothetical protein
MLQLTKPQTDSLIDVFVKLDSDGDGKILWPEYLDSMVRSHSRLEGESLCTTADGVPSRRRVRRVSCTRRSTATSWSS